MNRQPPSRETPGYRALLPTRAWASYAVSALFAASASIAMLAAPAVPVHAAPLRAIADVPTIETYKMHARLQVGDDPPAQLVEVEGTVGRDPHRRDLQITVEERGRPMVIRVREIGDAVYYSAGSKWGEIEVFHLEELVVVTPEHLLEIGDRLEQVGTETVNEREVLHLRGDKGDLPLVRSGSDSIDFSKMESAIVDIWVDAKERFVVKLSIAAMAHRGDTTFPLSVHYDYSHFNDEVTIEAPTEADLVPPTEAPPSSSQEEIDAKLGFTFPIPGNAHVSIYGATVSVLTAIPLAEARQYADRSMRGAGFSRLEEVERHPGEFYTDYRKDGRSIGVLVFQVTETGATIQVNAIK